MDSQFAIKSSQLRKVYGKTTAVNGLDLTVNRGEVFGFLGPNGAGKTTSIKMFLGLTKPSEGDVKVLGYSPSATSARKKIGFLPEHFRFHEWLTAVEFLRVHGQLYQMDNISLQSRIPFLLELVGLAPHQTQQLKTFSKGMLQRIGLAQALLNTPELVFLDEPTSGLDPIGRRLVRDIIKSLRNQGATVFLNSHLLSEVEITCDRVAFIKHGEVLRVSELKSLVDGETTLEAHVQGINPDHIVALSQWGKDVRIDGVHLHMVVHDEEALPAINRFLVEQNVNVFAFTPKRISLEDLFIHIVGNDGGL